MQVCGEDSHIPFRGKKIHSFYKLFGSCHKPLKEFPKRTFILVILVLGIFPEETINLPPQDFYAGMFITM